MAFEKMVKKWRQLEVEKISEDSTSNYRLMTMMPTIFTLMPLPSLCTNNLGLESLEIEEARQIMWNFLYIEVERVRHCAGKPDVEIIDKNLQNEYNESSAK